MKQSSFAIQWSAGRGITKLPFKLAQLVVMHRPEESMRTRSINGFAMRVPSYPAMGMMSTTKATHLDLRLGLLGLRRESQRGEEREDETINPPSSRMVFIQRIAVIVEHSKWVACGNDHIRVWSNRRGIDG
jgi:hypothetical protein